MFLKFGDSIRLWNKESKFTIQRGAQIFAFAASN